MKMILVKLATGLCALAFGTVGANAQAASQPKDTSRKEAQIACGTTAMTAYVKANLALMQESKPLMSVETTIAQRRLEEQYCLQFVHCVLDDQKSLQFITAFDSCLRDEALEKYDLAPRAGD